MAIPPWKFRLIVFLAVVAAGLAGLRVSEAGLRRAPAGAEEIARLVERVLSEHQGEIRRDRVWKVHPAGTSFTRTEQRVSVPPEFDSIEFNLALARRLAPLGATLVATERSKEATVAMHVVAAGATVYSVILVTDPDYHTKENGH